MRREKEARVLEAATAVFLRYGYRRTTMGDLAEAAGISRPALYLLYCNKERIFEAALRRLTGSLLEDIRKAIAAPASPREKLRLAFELWAVRPFRLLRESPDARDLIQCGHEFAREALDQSQALFEAQLSEILASFPDAPEEPRLIRTAHLLATSVLGFKSVARSVAELQELIEAQLDMTVASLAPRS